MGPTRPTDDLGTKSNLLSLLASNGVQMVGDLGYVEIQRDHLNSVNSLEVFDMKDADRDRLNSVDSLEVFDKQAAVKVVSRDLGYCNLGGLVFVAVAQF